MSNLKNIPSSVIKENTSSPKSIIALDSRGINSDCGVSLQCNPSNFHFCAFTNGIANINVIANINFLMLSLFFLVQLPLLVKQHFPLYILPNLRTCFEQTPVPRFP